MQDYNNKHIYNVIVYQVGHLPRAEESCFASISRYSGLNSRKRGKKGGKGTAVAQWLRCSATNRKVAGSIPAGASGFLIDIQCFGPHYGPGVGSASNRNDYQEYFLGVKVAGA